MVWAKIDDEILDNEKILGAGVLGFALHVAAITWSCRALTDGFIPYARVRLLLDFADLRHELVEASSTFDQGTRDSALEVTHELGAVEPLKIADNLVRQELWVEDKTRGGYWLHDFLDYNPSREKVMAERERGRARAKASFGRTKEESSGEDSPKNRRVFASSSDGPVPDPDPVPDQDSLGLVGITAPQLKLTVPTTSSSVVNDVEKPRTRGSRLSADWQPSETTQAWARREGLAEPCGRVLDEFRDFWRSVPGARGVKLDWDATYRNRVRQVAQRSTPTMRGPGGGPRGDRQGLGGWTPPVSTGTDDPFGGDS